MKNVFFKVLLRTDRLNTDNTMNVCIRITYLRKVKVLSTGVKVFPKHWNEKTLRIKATDYQSIYKNSIIDSKLNILQNIYVQLLKQGSEISLDKFNCEITKHIDFYEFVLKQVKKRQLSAETKRTYSTQISKLIKFKPELGFNEITPDFIQSYKTYMVEQLLNKPNTLHKAVSMLRTFCNWAIEMELIRKNPFENIQIKKFAGNRMYLTSEELHKLQALYNSKSLNEQRQSILGYFLFSCYTGLRFTDVRNLRKIDFYNEIHDNVEYDFLKIDMHKTGVPVTIPVIPVANQFYSLANKLENEKIFWVRCNQLTNRQLKVILQLAGINKNISFHSARHTFATVGLELGVPISDISQILGHTTIKQTQIYAKVQQKSKLTQLLKFETIA